MLRHPLPQDFSQISEILLRVGDSGNDATDLFVDPTLLGAIYALPYATLLPDWSWVVEDDAGVVGVVSAATDTETFESDRDRLWFPNVRSGVPDPGPRPASDDDLETFCQRFVHHPIKTQPEIAATWPAHMHLNVHPRGHGRGYGRALCTAVLDKAREKGISGIHVGVSPRNAGGLAFWSRMGFAPANVQTKDGAVWLGQRL